MSQNTIKAVSVFLLLVLLAVTTAFAGSPSSLPAFVVEGLSVEHRADVDFELRPVQVWTDDAVVALHYPDGRLVEQSPEPVRRWLGRITGEPGSRVMISERPDGAVRGLLSSGSQYWILPWTQPGEAVVFSQIDQSSRGIQERREDFSCQTKEPPRDVAALLPAIQPQSSVAATRGSHSFTARVALETDAEYLGRFGGNISAAVAYAGDLFAFISGIYEDELDTSLALTYISLWPEGHPWQHTSVICALYETGGFWNSHRTNVDRTIMHYLSGRNMGGGVAWLGVLCSGPFGNSAGGCDILPSTTGQYGGAYGVSANISGSFNPNSPGAVWDMVVVAHEIGHNFQSPHTHCYIGLGGNSEPVDRCHSGDQPTNQCHQGDVQLPGPQGQGSGTIMSYCHLRAGGLSNIAPSMGLGHSFGVAPERVPARMFGHTQQRANQFPGCLAPLEGYQLSVTPPETTLCLQGIEPRSLRHDLLVYSSGGLDQPVSLQFQSPEAGITGDLSPSSVTAPGASVLNITIAPGVPSGDYELQVTSSSGGLTADLPIRLVVTGGDGLDSPELLSPGESELALVAGMPLSWTPVGDASAYRVQIASDASFQNVVADWEVESVNSATVPSGLAPGTQYFWRVAALNECGTGAYSAGRSFGMAHAICQPVNQGIPDGSPAGLDSVMTIAEPGIIDELKFGVRIQHTWVGDLSATLTAPDGTTEVRLFQRPGVPESTWGCSGNNIDVVLDDGAPDDVQSACDPAPPAISGWLTPLEDLSVFAGAELAGDWTLNVSDAATPDPGVLIEWCLYPGLRDDRGDPLFSDRFQPNAQPD